MSAGIMKTFIQAWEHSTFLPVTGLLSALVMMSLWQGRGGLQRAGLLRLYGALAAFGISRLWQIIAPSQTIPPEAVWLVYSLLNLTGFYLLADFAAKLVRSSQWIRAVSTDTGSPAVAPAFRVLNPRAMLYSGLAGGVTLAAVRSALSYPTTLTGLAGAFAVGATAPAVIVLLKATRRSPRSLRGSLSLATVLLATACGLSIAAAALPRSAEILGLLAQTADVGSLFVVLGTVVTNYIRIGLDYKARVSEKEAEQTTARQELEKLNRIANNLYEDSADLIRKQKAQTIHFMRRVESLEKILQIGISIQRKHRLDEVLQMIVDVIRENLGFQTVTLRLFNERSQSFETQAHVGLGEDVRDTVVNYRIPLSEYQKMIEPRFRIRDSYFIRNGGTWQVDGFESGSQLVVEDTWREIDTLIVPLMGENEETVGYISAENPEDRRLSVAEAIETLENIASLAVITIRNARVFKELKSKNEKLRVYAEKLSGLNKLKSNFVATISHEFRTPLTSIRAYCDTLLRNAENVDRDLLKQFLGVIDEESHRLMNLIEDILDFSQMESGAARFQPSLSDLREIAGAAAAEIGKNLEAKKITLHREMPETPVRLRCENELIRQLLVNLLHNAAKFTNEGGNVWLAISEDAACVRITVEDDGIGIPEDQLESIFEQFHQVDGSTTRQYSGSGLGLAICRNIVEWHEGRIWVESVEGGGAGFVCVIPKRQVIARWQAPTQDNSVRRFEIERLLELLVENVAEQLAVQKASIMLLDPEGKLLRMVAGVGIDEETLQKAQVKIGEGIAGRVAEDGVPMLVADIETDRRLGRSNNDSMYGSNSFLSVPIKTGASVIGVVNVATPTGRSVFNDDDRLLLETLSERLAIAIGKLQAFTESSVRYEQIRDLFTAMLETRRYIDRQGDEWLSKVAVRAAQLMGMAARELQELRYVFNIYDLGLSKVGYHILKKPRGLSRNDREQVATHTETGPEMLSAVETSKRVENIVRSHHENFDGSGYPDGLRGEEIPLAARIIRVVDTLRAMISHRPYQRQHTVSEAIALVKERSGWIFDPKVVEAFLTALNEQADVATTERIVRR